MKRGRLQTNRHSRPFVGRLWRRYRRHRAMFDGGCHRTAGEQMAKRTSTTFHDALCGDRRRHISCRLFAITRAAVPFGIHWKTCGGDFVLVACRRPKIRGKNHRTSVAGWLTTRCRREGDGLYGQTVTDGNVTDSSLSENKTARAESTSVRRPVYDNL